MRVAIVNLTGGRLSWGYIKYLENIIPSIRRHHEIADLLIGVPKGVTLHALRALDPQSVITLDAGVLDRGLKRRIIDWAPDVIFFPTARWIDFGHIPTAVMIRNMEPFEVPWRINSLQDVARNVVRAFLARKASKRATRLIAVSQHVRDYITTRWSVDPRKVGLVYHGVEQEPDGRTAIRPAPLSNGDIREFFLSVGSIRPGRGLEDVLHAMSIVARTHRSATLVIAGVPDGGSKAYSLRMRRLSERLKIEDRILWVGHLGRPQLSWCFFHCAAFVTTSRSEACPNTLLEAMSHGCQIVSTRKAPMPEFLEDAASYYEPLDGTDLAYNLRAVLDSAASLKEMRRQRILSRASTFTWQNTVDNTIRELRQACDGLYRVSARCGS
jgi:glycosyltransferase involved in cell wall biosynthesis